MPHFDPYKLDRLHADERKKQIADVDRRRPKSTGRSRTANWSTTATAPT